MKCRRGLDVSIERQVSSVSELRGNERQMSRGKGR